MYPMKGYSFQLKGTPFVVSEEVLPLLVEYLKGVRVVQATMIPEPTNPHDPNAIQVVIQWKSSTLHVGYMPKEACPHLLLAIRQDSILRVLLVWSEKLSGPYPLEVTVFPRVVTSE